MPALRTIFLKHVSFWKDSAIRRHLLVGSPLLAGSLLVTYFSKDYLSSYTGGKPIPDLLLDHLPVFNVNYIFFQGAVLFVVALVLILICEPKYIPFTLVSTASFFTVRAIFTIMTHLVSPGSAVYQYVDYEHHVREVVFSISSGNDLFFSGHAGYPFLLALVFWKSPLLRYFFLVCSATGSIIVILGHLHYTIDVFSAFFIAFGIFEICKKFFKKEFALI